jgi:arginase
VLGGDCSILLGTMLALRRRGRYGLLYIDGDADFYQPEVNPLNGAASASDLAFATGYGPGVVTDIEGQQPLVRAADVVVFACRDAADRKRRGCQPLPTGLLVADRDQVRRLGAGAAAREAVGYLTRDGGPEEGFWIHLDADVLDETIMQAVDDPRPDGLAWEDLVSALSVAVHSGHAVGLQVAIYNPDIDADGSNGRGLAATVREALAASADM